MIRPLITLAAVLVSLCTLQAQTDDNPVVWNFSLGHDAGVHAVLAQADVAEGWYVYGQFIEEGGPIPTSIDLMGTPGIVLRGAATETGDVIAGFDALFEMDVTKFKNHASFTQAFDLPAGATTIKGTLEFMTCTDKKCLPPTTVDIALAVAEQ